MERHARSLLLASLSVALLPAGAEAGAILFDAASNFRETRYQEPRTAFQGDNLVLSINVRDADTGDTPSGAIVMARNTGTGEVFALVNEPDTVEYFRFVPWTPERAAGEWVVEVQSDVGSGTALLAAAGNGPGTGPVPGVQDLAVTGAGAARTMTWSTPADVLDGTANDGNVDRLRARVGDSNFVQLLDDRRLGLPNDAASLAATSYDIPDGVITHNGLFLAQMMVEGLDPFIRARTFEQFLVEDVGEGGAPVTFDETWHFRSQRNANSLDRLPGDRVIVGGFVSDGGGTYVHATQGDEIIGVAQSPEAFLSHEFDAGFDYDPSLTGAWEVTAWNGAFRTVATTNAIGDVAPVGFARNVRVTPDNLTPTLQWDLPADGGDPFEQVYIEVLDDSTDQRLAIFDGGENLLRLGAGATSYTFREGQLEFGRAYVANIRIAQTDEEGFWLSISNTFANFTPLTGTLDEAVFLPTVDTSITPDTAPDAAGVVASSPFVFDFDVTDAVRVRLDPFVAVGYDYAVGANDLVRFATVRLPSIGDDLFDLWLYDDAGALFDTGLDLLAGTEFDLRSLDFVRGVDYAGGAARFRILGIETSAGLDPTDVTAFVTELGFVGSGPFTGSMTPLTVFVASTVPEPGSLALLGAGMIGWRGMRRRGTARAGSGARAA